VPRAELVHVPRVERARRDDPPGRGRRFTTRGQLCSASSSPGSGLCSAPTGEYKRGRSRVSKFGGARTVAAGIRSGGSFFLLFSFCRGSRAGQAANLPPGFVLESTRDRKSTPARRERDREHRRGARSSTRSPGIRVQARAVPGSSMVPAGRLERGRYGGSTRRRSEPWAWPRIAKARSPTACSGGLQAPPTPRIPESESSRWAEVITLEPRWERSPAWAGPDAIGSAEVRDEYGEYYAGPKRASSPRGRLSWSSILTEALVGSGAETFVAFVRAPRAAAQNNNRPPAGAKLPAPPPSTPHSPPPPPPHPAPPPAPLVFSQGPDGTKGVDCDSRSATWKTRRNKPISSFHLGGGRRHVASSLPNRTYETSPDQRPSAPSTAPVRSSTGDSRSRVRGTQPAGHVRGVRQIRARTVADHPFLDEAAPMILARAFADQTRVDLGRPREGSRRIISR